MLTNRSYPIANRMPVALSTKVGTFRPWMWTAALLFSLFAWFASIVWTFEYTSESYTIGVADGRGIYYSIGRMDLPAYSLGFRCSANSHGVKESFGFAFKTLPEVDIKGTIKQVIVPFWPLVTVLAVPTCISWVRWHRNLRRAVGLCSKCGYDLTGNESGVCSECGTPVNAGSA